MTSQLHHRDRPWEGDRLAHSLKVAVIREEFVALTGNPLIAVVLNQLLYWTQRVKDFDLLLEEEIKRNPECNVPLRHGWIYKSADDLSDETMLLTTRPTMRKYLKFLVGKGWVDEKANPRDKWDRTTQYRLNLRKLQDDLFTLGYCIPGFSCKGISLSSEKMGSLKTEDCSKNDVVSLNENKEYSMERNLTSMLKKFPLKEKNLTSYTYTETTPKIINKDHTQSVRDLQILLEGDDSQGTPLLSQSSLLKSDNPLHERTYLQEVSSHLTKKCSSIPEEMVNLWKQHIGQEKVHLTQDRARQLEFLLSSLFQNDLCKWEVFCERVRASSFLMGQGANKWHVTFDWILAKENVLKVLEGNYDNPERLEQNKEQHFRKHRDLEIRKVLDAIEDNQWKYWCTELSRTNSITLGELKAISQARFVKFDERLVWIESSDPKTLSHIEDNRLMLLSVIKQTYPNARNLRTQKEERGENILSSYHGSLENYTIAPSANSEKLNLSSEFPFQENLILTQGNPFLSPTNLNKEGNLYA